jgi:alpha-galactosidase
MEGKIKQEPMSSLSSHHFDLLIEPEEGAFSLRSNAKDHSLFQDARMLVIYRQQGQRRFLLSSSWQINQELIETYEDVNHGQMHSMRLAIEDSSSDLRISLIFSLPESHPLFLWKLNIENNSGGPVSIERIELLRAGGQTSQGSFQFVQNSQHQYSFYSNGWQSWSHTGTYLQGTPMRITRLGLLQEPAVLNPGTPRLRSPGYFTADFFGAVCDLTSRTGLLAGFLSQRQHFGTLEAVLYDQPSLRLWANGDDTRLDPGQIMETDWAVITLFSLDNIDPLEHYTQAVAREHKIHVKNSVPSGWCSWYHYYTDITPDNMRSNLQALKGLRETTPLDQFQIDDGFEAQVGDWFDFKPAFSQGVEPLAREIREAGFQPGLWLAPFILHPKAKTIREHPDWILRNAKGRPANCGFGWNALTQGLDLTVPEALEYASSVVRTASHDWGYPYLKLDFLYAAAVNCRYSDPTKTRAQVLRAGMQALRDAAGPETFLVGCGLPLGSGLGLVDSMRIGEDVSGDWHPHFHGIGAFIKNEPFLPCARNSIHNILTRSPLHNRWWINDPDCLLVRPDTNLSLAEVQTLASVIALSGGALLLSDDLTNLPEDRRRIAEVLLPLIGKSPQVIDLFDQITPARLRLDLDGPAGAWHLLAWFNWDDKPQSWHFHPQDFNLENGKYILRSFWDASIIKIDSAEKLNMPSVPPHGGVVLAVRKVIPNEPLYLGSDLHFSQGLEVSRWQPSGTGLELELNLPRQAQGNIYLWLQSTPCQISSSSKLYNWSKVEPDIYKIPVAMNRQESISIQFE